MAVNMTLELTDQVLVLLQQTNQAADLARMCCRGHDMRKFPL
jgi:hypothetical protein